MEAGSIPAEATAIEGADGAEETQAPPEAEATETPNPLEERFDQLAGEMREYMEQSPVAPPEEREQEETPDPRAELDELMDEDGTVDPDQLLDWTQEQIKRGIQEHIGPVQQQVEGVQRYLQDAQLDALETEYPELQDPKAAKELTDEVKNFALSRGHPELAGDPEFVETMHLARRARESGQSQTAATAEPGTHLEAGGGASPGTPEEDPAKRILQAGGARSVFGQ